VDIVDLVVVVVVVVDHSVVVAVVFWHQYMKHQQQQQDGTAGATGGFQMPSHMADFLGSHTGKELAELIEAHLPEWLRTEQMNEMLTKLKTGEQADKPVEHNALLENVGKLLREFLSPFGIDCDYFVDSQQSAKPKEEEEVKPKATEEAKPNTEEEPSSNSSVELKPSAPPSEAAAAAATASATSTVPPLGNLFQQLQSMLGPMMQQQNTVSTDAEAAKDQKKIDECVERMTAMGFVDSNGVLTELIKSKKGDLNQVLDALNPRNYKN